MWTILFIIGAAAVIYGVPKLWPFGEKEAKMPEFFTLRLFGGPMDKSIERVPKEKDPDGNLTPPHFYIAAYPPELDEQGNPPVENVVGWMYGKIYIKPNYAYYQQVTDEDYFYVRDIDEEEIARIQSGTMPSVEAPETTE